MLVIDAINDMLAYLGESPLDPSDPDYTEHPMYASALRVLNTTNTAVQSKGWWFNTYRAVLTPVANAISISSSILSIEVLNTLGDLRDYTIRNGALFNLTDNTAVLTDPVTAYIRTLIPFEQLPATAAAYIAARAASRFVKTFDGDRGKLADAEKEEGLSYIPFNADHIRNARVNLYQTASVGPILANNWYSRYRQR
jgi:hypothetical protein